MRYCDDTTKRQLVLEIVVVLRRHWCPGWDGPEAEREGGGYVGRYGSVARRLIEELDLGNSDIASTLDAIAREEGWDGPTASRVAADEIVRIHDRYRRH